MLTLSSLSALVLLIAATTEAYTISTGRINPNERVPVEFSEKIAVQKAAMLDAIRQRQVEGTPPLTDDAELSGLFDAYFLDQAKAAAEGKSPTLKDYLHAQTKINQLFAFLSLYNVWLMQQRFQMDNDGEDHKDWDYATFAPKTVKTLGPKLTAAQLVEQSEASLKAAGVDLTDKATAEMRHLTNKFFKKHDTDNDGALTTEELKAAALNPEAQKEMTDAAKQWASKHGIPLSAISPQEEVTVDFLVNHMEMLIKERSGVTLSNEAKGELRELLKKSYFEKHDKNGDGVVSEAEHIVISVDQYKEIGAAVLQWAKKHGIPLPKDASEPVEKASYLGKSAEEKVEEEAIFTHPIAYTEIEKPKAAPHMNLESEEKALESIEKKIEAEAGKVLSAAAKAELKLLIGNLFKKYDTDGDKMLSNQEIEAISAEHRNIEEEFKAWAKKHSAPPAPKKLSAPLIH